MSEKTKEQDQPLKQDAPGTKAAAPETSEAEESAAGPVPAEKANSPQDELVSLKDELESLKKSLAAEEDKYLRLAAEYDNYRRRTQREKSAAWTDAQADTALAFLPVYDNLERALKQETADKAYAKGVEMTMTQFKGVLEKLNIHEIPTVGTSFDPSLHNAIMHVEDENLGKNTVAESFQSGFKLGDKIIRVAMVKVAN